MPEQGSFGRWAKDLLSPWKQQIRFVGRLDKANYKRLLKSSHVHCYLTRPYVASWSLVEAMASGCCLVANDVKPVQEVAHAKATYWCDMLMRHKIAHQLGQALKSEERERLERGAEQRARAVSQFSQEACLQRWTGLLGNCHN